MLACDSGVPNLPIPPSAAFPDGCTIEDQIVACAEASSSPGQRDKCVKALLNELRKQQVITERQRKAVDTCLKKSKKRHVAAHTRAAGGATDH